VEVGEVLESELSHGRVHFTSVCRNIRKLRLCKSEHPKVFSPVGVEFETVAESFAMRGGYSNSAIHAPGA
ncbi:MAG: hypothetical protein OXH03_07295, partial [Bacteroidetes bacterium]|nr:hypothetical protein [Bacteroidota bacterium]MDE2672635.1 hypothetical protein [Bacteroidota bacterium]